jgi:hypothetical protein
MKKTLLFTLIFSLLIVPVALAQPFQPFYWIRGGVEDPDGVGTEGRQVVVYNYPLENNQIVGGYADDVVGLAGQLRQAGLYTVNACEDMKNMPLVVGRYFVAITNDNTSNPGTGYGADPVEVSLTGVGYDVAPQLRLVRGAGPLRPRENRGGPPAFSNITFGNRRYQPNLVAKGGEFIVAAQPKVTTSVSSPWGINVSSIAMVLNEGLANSKTYTINAANVTRVAGPTESPTEIRLIYDFLAEKQTLPEGTQKLTFRANNVYGNATEVCSVTVAGGEPRLIGAPLCYPSPLHLKTDKEVIFEYTLSQNMAVEMSIVNVAGKTVLRRLFTAGSEGGSAGVNKVTWDLTTNQGQNISSGIYIFTLINKDNGKLLGKGKLTSLP